MKQKLYDLTQYYGAGIPPWPAFPDPIITSLWRIPHDGQHSLKVETAMHIGTHIDAPLHTYSKGWDLSEIPLDVLFGEGIVVDLRDEVKEWDIITPKMIERNGDVKEGDILILNLGWEKYSWKSKTHDEETFFCKHPGPELECCKWVLKKKLRWFGVDAPGLEHPFQTKIRLWRPDLVAEYEKRTGKPIEKTLPMKNFLCCHHLMAQANMPGVENVGGEINAVTGRRMKIGIFPWRWIRGEGCISRIVAFEGF